MIQKKCILLTVISCFMCCGDNDIEILSASRTVLVYMAADNNLYKNAKTDIEEMLQSGLPANNHLLVYLDVPY